MVQFDALTIRRQPHVETEQEHDFRSILLDSFPPSELDDIPTLLASIGSDQRLLYTASLDSHLIGFAILVPIVAPGIHLLEYLAVSPAQRNRGVGAQLLRSVTAALSDGTDGILLEIESPEDAADEERLMRDRRIGFYLRQGAVPVTCAPNYQVPDMTGPSTLGMKLFWLPLQDASPPSGTRLRDCIVGIFSKSYGLPATAPIPAAVLAGLTC